MSKISAIGHKHRDMQLVQRLVAKRALRAELGLAVIEGAKLLSEALDAGVVIEQVLFEPAAPTPLIARARESGAKVTPVIDGAIAHVSDAVSPQPIIATVRPRSVDASTVLDGRFVVVCVDVRDPGNAGTILRSADAAGADGVVFCVGCVDPFNPKTLRAGAGAQFHVPFVADQDVDHVFASLASRGTTTVATVVSDGQDLFAMSIPDRVALVLGNEASGLDDATRERCDVGVTIPFWGSAESLNVSMAATLFCFEVARRQSNRRAPNVGRA